MAGCKGKAAQSLVVPDEVLGDELLGRSPSGGGEVVEGTDGGELVW